MADCCFKLCVWHGWVGACVRALVKFCVYTLLHPESTFACIIDQFVTMYSVGSYPVGG